MNIRRRLALQRQRRLETHDVRASHVPAARRVIHHGLARLEGNSARLRRPRNRWKGGKGAALRLLRAVRDRLGQEQHQVVSRPERTLEAARHSRRLCFF